VGLDVWRNGRPQRSVSPGSDSDPCSVVAPGVVSCGTLE